ncbi:hypothetical protein [Limisphaera sp. 4302-co]|uniref:hypothetical protein n=1 Tax=Limisphaera sp. 4302-co TaxID=3400417 RepID=UPI003C13339C
MQIIRFLLSNSPAIIAGGYGLKCIVFMHATIPVHERYTPLYSFHFVEVKGTAALLSGLGYIGLAVFTALSCGFPPDEDRSWTWRVARVVLRWGSLLGGFFAWQAVYKIRS